MKKCVIVFLSVFSSVFSYGQNDSSFFFNEFSLSANYTNLKDDNTEDRFGFGFGMYRSSRKRENKITSLTFGIEFNRTSQFKKQMYNDHYAYSTDLTYNFSYLSAPVLARLSFGKTTKLFIEPGAFFEFYVGGKKKGTEHRYSTTDSSTTLTEFNNRAELAGINFGPSFGLGVKTPIGKHNLIIKIDYKLGLNTLWDYHDQLVNRYLRLVLTFRI